MKRVILAVLAVGMMVFCMCGVAHAQEPYTCEGGNNPVPASVSGNIDITESGSCTIKHSLSATGSISINAGGAIEMEGTVATTEGDIALTGTDVSTGEISSGEGFGVTASGNVKVGGEVSINTYGEGGHVLIIAQGEVATGSITGNGGTHASVVEIQADQGGGNQLFTIGGSGHSNGVNGSINISNTTGGGTEPLHYRNWVEIVNGTSPSTGGITLESMGDVEVTDSASRSGTIILRAQNGVLTLPSGNLWAGGSTGEPAGNIFLLAHEVTAPSGASITSNQEPAAAELCHQIAIAASTVSYGGSGLQIQANGNGYDRQCGSDVSKNQQGSLTVSYNGNELNYIEPILSWTYNSNPLTVSGTGPLEISTQGSNGSVVISGKELTLGSTDGSETSIYADGSDNYVNIVSQVFGGSERTPLKVTGPLQVYAQAQESGATAGEIYVAGSEISELAGHVTLSTQGEGGAGGGTIRVSTNEGELPLGESGSSITLNVSAVEGGNAGTLKVEAGSGAVKIGGENAMYASAFGANGNAGTIEITGGAIENVAGSNTTIFANAEGSGLGGTITLASAGTLSIGGGTEEFTLETIYESTGGGGTINLSGSEVNINGGYIFASAYPTTGNGGTINVTSTGKLNVSDEYQLRAEGAGVGNGGQISLKGEEVNFEGTGSAISANAAEVGDGGSISIEATNGSIDVSSSEEHGVYLSADSGSTSGNGGDIKLTGGAVHLEGSAFSASAQASGNGGTLEVKASGALTTSEDIDIELDGAGNGEGGDASLTGKSIEFAGTGSSISADGAGSGDGGKISLHATEGTLDMNSSEEHGVSLTADAGSTGNGGEVSMAAPEVKVDGAYVSVSAAKGNGGTITVSETGELKVSNEAELKADGGENGNGGGGEISLTAESIELEEATIEANGSGTGHGGEIKLDSEAGIIISGILEANADPSGDGDGGLVDIESKDEINVEEEKIYAEGSDEGEGGIVEIGDVSNFSVDELIGDSEGIMALPIVAAGEITLNHDPCKKYQNPEGTSEWPKKYWDCANPTSPTALDEVLVKAVTKYLKPALRKSSGSSKIELYIFAKQSEWETYFKRTLPEPVSGITWQASNGGTIYVSVFEEKPGGGLYAATQLSETSIHEAGHGFDHLFKQDNESANSRYATWLQADLTNLNLVSPCTPSGGKEAPFFEVENSAKEFICSGTTLNSKYSGMTNSEILLQEGVGKYWFAAKENEENKTGYAELFAQALAFEAYASKLASRSEFAFNVPDNVFKNGYFSCVREWVQSLQNGEKEPPTNTACGDS